MVYSRERPIAISQENYYGSSDVYCGCNTTMAPVPAQVRSMSQIVVPVFSAISYDSLTSSHRYRSGDTTPGPYPSISCAYRTAEGHKYMTRNAGCS
jgi:hypothetical protein